VLSYKIMLFEEEKLSEVDNNNLKRLKEIFNT
jgi:hypothetical protein